MAKRVWVLVTNDLVTDQRVNKVCITLQKAGFEPYLIGVLNSDSIPVNRVYPTLRMKMLFNKSALFYAEYNLKVFFKILFSKFHFVLSNDTDTLLGAYMATFIRRKPIVFDAHELFTEVPELIHKPFIRKVWQTIENLILPHIKYAYTVCQPIADIYKQKNGIEMQVVRNAPFAKEISDKTSKHLSFGGKKMILYQGAVNVGRGIEWVIDAMPYLDNVVYCIAGDGDIYGEIEKRIAEKNLYDRVFLLGKIPFEELHKYTLSADIGLCLLENRGLNYYYSLPNRVFDFTQAEVPILATDFPEINTIVSKYNLGVLIDNYDPEYLANVIQEMLIKWNDVSDKKTIFAEARKNLCWEKDEEVLLELFSKV